MIFKINIVQISSPLSAYTLWMFGNGGCSSNYSTLSLVYLYFFLYFVFVFCICILYLYFVFVFCIYILYYVFHIMDVWQGAALVITQHCVTRVFVFYICICICICTWYLYFVSIVLYFVFHIMDVWQGGCSSNYSTLCDCHSCVKDVLGDPVVYLISLLIRRNQTSP